MVTIIKLIPYHVSENAISDILGFCKLQKRFTELCVSTSTFTTLIRMHFLPLVVATFIKDLLIVWFDIITVA